MICKVEISFGELIDKITILEIKSNRIQNSLKIKMIRKELASLNKEFKKVKRLYPDKSSTADRLKKILLSINSELWVIEDKIRKQEAEKKFNRNFIQLARKIYLLNDKRSEIKEKINILLKSKLTEIKEYKKY